MILNNTLERQDVDFAKRYNAIEVSMEDSFCEKYGSSRVIMGGKAKGGAVTGIDGHKEFYCTFR